MTDNTNTPQTSQVVSSGSNFRISEPEKFNFTDEKVDAWPKWKRRFEHFRISSKLNTASEEE